MKKAMIKSSICVLVVAMFFIPSVALAFSNEDEHDYHGLKEINAVKENYENENILRSSLKDRQVGLLSFILSKILSQTVNNKIIDSDDEGKTISCLDDVDQSQEQSDNFYKIYGTNWFAQSFTPTRGELTRVEIRISKHTKSLNPRMMALSSRVGVIERIRSVFMKNDLGYITVEIRDSLDGTEVTSRSLSPDEVPKNSDGHWIEFNVYDIELRVDSTYYMVVYANGGDDNNYYTWCFGDGNPYDAGMAYSSSNAGSSWDTKPNFDFCFRTYGYYSGEEPDGITERWAVLFTTWPDEPGVSLNEVRDCLIHHGWEEDHIKRIFEATSYDVQSAISWVDSVDDQDDIFLIYSSTHGGKGFVALADKLLYYEELDGWLDNCGASIFYSISACHCGSAIPILGQKGRVIMTACKEDERGSTMWLPFFLYYEYDRASDFGYIGAPSPNGAFCREDCDLNGDGWISAEEAFPYAKEWVEKVNNEWWKPEWPLHPQMYDGYDGELLITQVGG